VQPSHPYARVYSCGSHLDKNENEKEIKKKQSGGIVPNFLSRALPLIIANHARLCLQYVSIYMGERQK